jgi:hypothetical protein
MFHVDHNNHAGSSRRRNLNIADETGLMPVTACRATRGFAASPHRKACDTGRVAEFVIPQWLESPCR